MKINLTFLVREIFYKREDQPVMKMYHVKRCLCKGYGDNDAGFFTTQTFMLK